MSGNPISNFSRLVSLLLITIRIQDKDNVCSKNYKTDNDIIIVKKQRISKNTLTMSVRKILC